MLSSSAAPEVKISQNQEILRQQSIQIGDRVRVALRGRVPRRGGRRRLLEGLAVTSRRWVSLVRCYILSGV